MRGAIELLCAGLLVVACGGCLRSGSLHAGPEKPREEPKRLAPVDLSSHGIRLRWQERVPEGRLRPVLELMAETGNLDTDAQSGRLQHTRGDFYRGGNAVARFTAPIVDARQSARRIQAWGGVRVESAADPGTTLTADRVTWDAASGEIIASGRVSFSHRRPGGLEDTASGGPFDRVTYNPDRRLVTIP